ncbi:hypothetical protein KUF71_010879 [Frankliniella fusca]|uniref:Protein split ends-like n=1 Tax=Frankliniella fusca TaxID=407009 RepID=A0AAE1LK96_9NEOP|nr:hypothetical protein KUF71_010879 [Frankliniella fusca]
MVELFPVLHSAKQESHREDHTSISSAGFSEPSHSEPSQTSFQCPCGATNVSQTITVSRRKSVRVSESFSDVASQDDVSSIQDETENSKPAQRPRRSTRRSFADTDSAPLTQRSTLSRIVEDSKPVTRRTRASKKPVEETDVELTLPPIRRTRQSSVSSVTSVSTIASNAPSPQRRTRASRRNLSPVPSPTFSEASAISEVPEVSPNLKKRDSPVVILNRSAKSLTPSSSNVSPAVQSSVETPDSQSRRVSLRDKSPMKTSESSFTTPRQLNLNDTGCSKNRSSLTNDEVEVINISDSDSGQKPRRSQGRLSLTRRTTPQKSGQFVESPMEEPAQETTSIDQESDAPSFGCKPSRISIGVGNADSERPRRNSGRLSLSKFVERPLSDSSTQDIGIANELSPKDNSSPAANNSELNKSLNSSRRLSVSKFVEKPLDSKTISSQDEAEVAFDNLNKSKTDLETSHRTSVGKMFTETTFKSTPSKETDTSFETRPEEDIELEKSARKSTGRTSMSSIKSPELDKPQHKSVERHSVTSDGTVDTNPEEECGNSGRKSTDRKSLSLKSPELEKSQRNSVGRLSLNSNKSLIIDLDYEKTDDDEPEKPSRKSNERVSCSPVKSPELEKSQRKSVDRFSLSSNKSLTSIDPENEVQEQLENGSRKSFGRSSVSPAKSPELQRSRRKSGSPSLTPNKSMSTTDQENEEIERIEKSSRKSMGRSSVSPAKSSKVDTSSLRKSVGRLSLSSNKSNQEIAVEEQLEKSMRKSLDRPSTSPAKSPELEKSQRKSSRFSLASNKAASDDENEDEPHEKSTRKSTGGLSTSPIKSPEPEKLQRNSIGRPSSTSNKSSPFKLDDSPHLTPRDVANLRSYFASSTPTAISKKEQSPVKEISLLEKSKANQLLNKSSGRLSLTPSKSATPPSYLFAAQADGDTGDDDSNGKDDDICDMDGDGDDAKDSSHVSIQNSASTSRRASTSNIQSEETLDSEGKEKYRASTGSLFEKSPLKSPVLTSEVKESLSTSHTNNQSNRSSHGDNSSSFNDKTKLGLSEGLSPIKQQQGELRNFTLTPSPSENSFNDSLCSPNQALEKSMVFNEQDLSSGSHTGLSDEQSSSTSHPSSRMNLQEASTSESSNLISGKNSPQKQPSDVLSPKDAKNETGKVPKSKALSVSCKVYKDAAILLSGGNISDFDDQEDDDADQWEHFPSPATKSKKELRLERKLRKQAEKELRKKSKLERIKHLQTSEDRSDVYEKEQTEKILEPNVKVVTPVLKMNNQALEDVVKESDATDIIHSDVPNRKRVRGSSDFLVSKRREQNSEERINKRKSLSEFVNSVSSKKMCLQLEDALSIPVGHVSEDNAGTQSDEIRDFDIESVDATETVPSEATKPLKKKKKKKNIHQVDSDNFQIPVAERSIKKTKKKKQVDESSENETDKPIKKKKKKVQDQANVENDSVGQSDEIKKKKKKVKTLVIAEDGSTQISKKNKKLMKKPSESEPEDGVKAVKKKKKVKKQFDTEAAVADTTKLVKKKKKKVNEEASEEAKSGDKVKSSKTKKFSYLDNDVDNLSPDVLEELSENIIKKKLKKSVSDDTTEEYSGSELPKKKFKIKFTDSSDQISLGASDAPESAKMTKKKKKKKKNTALLDEMGTSENGNNSDDDAPTSVSFAAGKEFALAELSAAAESIKKQKEMRKQKLKIKQDRIREEKLAKLNKIKKKQKFIQSEDADVTSSSGVSVSGSSYKIYFDGESNSEKSKLPKRLPDDFLESLSEQPPTKVRRRADGSKERVAAAAVSKEDQERLERKKAKKLARKLERRNMLQSDYVPLEGVLGSTRFGVVPLRNIMLAKKLEKNKLAEEASNFRQQSLFGNRIRRTPISSLLSHKEKLKASGKDRLVQSK